MNFIDMHCDTISRIYNSKENISLRDNNFQVDLNKLKKSNSKAQFFALFLDLDYVKSIDENPYNYLNGMLNTFYRELNLNKDILALAKNYYDMEKNHKENKISAFLTIEEGGALLGDLEKINEVYDKGVRLITLTWNYKNQLGYPNYNYEFKDKGLTNLGIEFVERLNDLGILIDVSHLSDGGFYDVLKYSKSSFVASHSNSRALCNHSRNLTDPMIKILAKKGGIIGLNFCTEFLSNDNISKVSYMIDHLKHIRNVGGIDVLAIGGDFDGINSTLEINNIGEMDKLLFALKKAGFKEDEIEKIWYKNAQRVIKEVL